jgi:hypothetical protein
MVKPFVVALVVCLASVSAGAAVLPVSAAFALGLPSLQPVTLTGTGIGSSVGGGTATVPAGIFAGNPKIVVPVTPTFGGLTQITVPANSVNNAAGSFAPSGAMALSGSAFFNPGGAAGSIPLAPIGGGGTGMGLLLAIKFTLAGATWMGGNQVFTHMGAALANPVSATATAFDNRTTGGIGTMQLVAPTLMQFTNPAFGVFPVFATLTLTYTPEPGTLTLLGVGIAGLVLRARGSRRAAV